MKKLLTLQCELNIDDIKEYNLKNVSGVVSGLKSLIFKSQDLLSKNNSILMNDTTLSILIDKLWLNNKHLAGQPSSRKVKVVIYWGERTLLYPGKYSYGSWRTLGHVQTVDCSLASRDAYLKYILARFALNDDSYYTMPYNCFYVAYGFVSDDLVLTLPMEGNGVTTIDGAPVEELIVNDIPLLVIPSADPKDWSAIVNVLSDKITQLSLQGKTFTFTRLDESKSHVVCATGDLVRLFEFTDVFKDNNNLKTFTRIFSKQSMHYVDGVLQYTTENDVKYIPGMPKHGEFSFNVITMDLETQLRAGVMEPISVSAYSPSMIGEYKTYFITDFKDSDAMVSKSILDLLLPEYNGFHVYLHNFSKFDGVFILKNLAKAIHSKDIKFLIRDRNILNITISYNFDKLVKGKLIKARGHISFHDSMLIVPGSLSKLAVNFGVTTKGDFDFTKLSNMTWSTLLNIKNELLNYNKRDCKVLYEIILKFAKGIHDQYQINITTYPTLSSIAFAIYRSNYIKKNFNIPITNKKDYDRMSKSYRGGHVDVYIPYGENLYCYDVNSLYPSVMQKHYFPVGQAKYFNKPSAGEGLFKDLNNIFGIVQVHVTCPKDMKLPILLHRYKDPATGTVSTICPVGKWTGWYFTEELKYAVTLGYQIEIIRGYHFDKRAKIFSKYVSDLYKTRSNYPKTHSLNIIAKLLLNSLYGRFGMSIYVMFYKLVTLTNLSINDSFEEIIDIGDDHALIGLGEVKNYNYDGNMIKTSVGIASAITAYARIAIHKFKLLAGEHLHYTDTDSIFTSKPLPKYLVGDKLGQMKLEYGGIIKKAVFLAPKLYALVLADDSEVVKIKGCKTKCSFNDMLERLTISSEANPLYQEKWIRNFKDGNISLETHPYSFAISDNKRKAIIENNKFVGTMAIVINEQGS